MTDEEWEQLREYSIMCGDSYGDVVNLIIELHNSSDYISKELKEALVKESKWNLRNFIENTTIDEREYTKTNVIKELNWNL